MEEDWKKNSKIQTTIVKVSSFGNQNYSCSLSENPWPSPWICYQSAVWGEDMIGTLASGATKILASGLSVIWMNMAYPNIMCLVLSQHATARIMQFMIHISVYIYTHTLCFYLPSFSIHQPMFLSTFFNPKKSTEKKKKNANGQSIHHHFLSAEARRPGIPRDRYPPTSYLPRPPTTTGRSRGRVVSNS